MPMDEDKRDLLLLAIIGAIILTIVMLTSGCAGLMPTPPVPASFRNDPLPRFACVYDPCKGANHDVKACTAALVRDPTAEVGQTCDIYRSAQPSDVDWKRLVSKYHIASEVKLNGLESLVKPPSSVRLYDLPLYILIVPSAERVAEIHDAIDHAPKPVLVHCTSGMDRTSAVVGTWRVKRQHADVNGTYLNDMILFDFHPYRGVWGMWARAVGWTL